MFTTKNEVVNSDGTVNIKLINKFVLKNQERCERVDKLKKYYVGRHDIMDRKRPEITYNNLITVNHAKYITDINTGYLLGNAVDYQVGDNTFERARDTVVEEFREQTVADLDVEIAKDLSIYGYQHELTYANEENDVRSKVISNKNCFLIYDNSVEEKKIAGVIYELKKDNIAYTADTCEYDLLTVYTDDLIIKLDSKGNLISEPEENQFGAIPIIMYKNNSDLLGDFETVISLIDAYNVLASDRVNDKEQLVGAVLALKGFVMDDERASQLKKNRILSMPADGDAQYLIKQLNEAEIQILRSDLENDIHKISMTPNMSDEKFVGNSSGVAIKYKLLPFEQSIKNKQRFFEEGLRDRFKLYNNYFVRLNQDASIPRHEVEVIFKRNLPQNDLETSQMVNNLTGLVSKETLISQLSYVGDASQELENVTEETDILANEELPNFGRG